MTNQPFDYLDSFQMHIMLYVIIGMGYFFSWRNFFNLDDCYSILRLIRLVSFSALMAREIALSTPTYFTWKPLIISFLTFTSIRIITIIISVIFTRKEIILKYLQFSFSYSYVNFFSFGYPFIHLFFGGKYEYICAIMNITQSFIMRPIDLILLHKFAPLNPTHLYLTVSPDSETETHLENLDHPEEKEADKSTPINNIEENLIADSSTNLPSSSSDILIFHDDQPLKKSLILTIFSPQNVCTLVGIIYSFSGWGIPPIVETVVSNFENMAVGTTLFFIGVALWSHPWKGCNYLPVILSLIIKHIITPLIALLFCWILKFDSLTSYCCIILFSMPSDYTGIAILPKDSLQPNPITFSFFFSQILGLPCFFAWIALFNETNLLRS